MRRVKAGYLVDKMHFYQVLTLLDADPTVRRYDANDTKEVSRGTGTSQVQLYRPDQFGVVLGER